MHEMEIGDIAWLIANRSQTEDDVKEILARLASVDYQSLMSKIEYEHHQWTCDLCHEFKDRRTFTYVLKGDYPIGKRAPHICPECFTAKAIFQAMCIGCQQVEPALADTTYTCSSCAEMKINVSNNNTRARRVHLPATLTLQQWVQTMRHFDDKCAYCSGSYQCLEHYLPLTLGGGSTVDNCLPGCYSCNLHKKNRHPDDFDVLFNASNLARIRAYLDNTACVKLD